MNSPGGFVSEPFEFEGGGILTVQALGRPARPFGAVEFRLEGSRDKAHWADLVAGTVSAGERVQVPCRTRVAPWGRVRIRALGADATVTLRRFGGGDGSRA